MNNKRLHKFKFVIHPSEFTNLFKDLEYFIAIINTRVNENYKITDKTSIFNRYSSYYEKVTSGEEWKKGDGLLNIYTHLIINPNHIKYGDKFVAEVDGETKTFKLATQAEESAINISPFSLQLDHKDRLSVMFFDGKHNSNIGLEFSYPTRLMDLKTKEIISTENLSTYKLYKELIRRIKKFSKKAKAIRNDNISKPNFWISPRCVNDINKNVIMKQNSIILK
ncbi:hypothetical protein QSV08_12385 [Maribacter sp. BPC-D8]|uniref:hypothetical protein n=1 Tax=Maribacter sp. BPC-D8 TaxID=3053613 RepID=UPI00193BD960|nr:hypothetical protein [Maribacter sp. BPC-D8]WRI28022.1 hypothetical protein QSV08_12385 [Maribacter sp. BPC-D8]